MSKLPDKLRHDTIYDFVFEIRFSLNDASSASLLPGMIFARLGPTLFYKSDELPLARVPLSMRNADPNLSYQPTHALSGDGRRLMLGARVMDLALARPYPGWSKVKVIAIKCVEALLGTGLVSVAERCSLKYTNLLTTGRDPYDLEQLKVRLRLDDFDLTRASVLIRTEIECDGCPTIIQVATNTIAQQNDAPSESGASGVLLDVDTILAGPFPNPAGELESILERLHNNSKATFFNLLTPETLAKLAPES